MKLRKSFKFDRQLSLAAERRRDAVTIAGSRKELVVAAHEQALIEWLLRRPADS